MDLQIKQIKSTIKESNILLGNFIFLNLFLGYGLTIGNTLRRVLLMNLKGIAIIAIKIPGVFSEFSSIIGLREDVLEILLNLKEVILQSTTDLISYGKIIVQGPGVITANCIQFNSNIKIINPNQYIATVYTKKKLIFEIIAMRSRGYYLNNNVSLIYPDFLNIDAIFTPILQVNYKINNRINFNCKQTESLLFEITTNGSISPKDALTEASTAILNIFNSCKINN